MNALLLDFVSRWRWILLAGILFAPFSVIGGMPVIVAPLGAILLLLDAQRGGIRVLRCLPMRIEEQGRFGGVATLERIGASRSAPRSLLLGLRHVEGHHLRQSPTRQGFV